MTCKHFIIINDLHKSGFKNVHLFLIGCIGEGKFTLIETHI
jgi:hypothetical protein